MGIGYGLHCNNCNYHKDIMLGIGILYMPEGLFERFDERKSLFEELVKSAKIRQHTCFLLKEKQGKIGEEYGRELYYCEKCNSVHNHFYYQVIHKDGIYEPDYRCNRCKCSLKRLKFSDNPSVEEITDMHGNKVILKCPKCSEGKLGINSLIMWD